MGLKVLVAGWILGALVAAQAQDDAVKKAADKLQGTWKVVKAVKDGEPVTGEEMEKMELVFKGDKIVFRDGNRAEDVNFTLDPSQKPAAIDFAPSMQKEMLIRGIYKLEGDTLTLCFDLNRKDRLKEFESKKNSQVRLLVLERMKK